MARAIEIDENGKTILTDGIYFGQDDVDLEQICHELDPADLVPGDVLIWYSASGNRKVSAIREFSGGAYSHIGIYTGNNFSVDAGPQGVAEAQIAIGNDGSYVHVLRKVGLSPQEQATVVAAARIFIGYRYAWFDAITSPLRRRDYLWRMNPCRSRWNWITGSGWLALVGRGLTSLRRLRPPLKKIFCSQVIVEAYAAIDYYPLELVELGVFSPNDLAVGGSFTYIGWLSPIKPIWHPLDPYSPEAVGKRRWDFSLARAFRGTSTGEK